MARFTLKTTIPKTKLFNPLGADIAFNSAVNSYMNEIDIQGTIIADQETPIGVTGQLADSIEFRRISPLNAEIAWTAPYARPVAEGSAPHFAPLRRLSEWTAIKWGDPDGGKALQEIIATRGTKGNGYPARTKKRVLNLARRIWPEKINLFVRNLLR